MKVLYADTPLRRLVGMLLGRGAGNDECLVLRPCSDIHTLGMRWPIDIAFVDAVGLVMRSECGVSPGKRRSCAGAYAVVERRACSSKWVEKGESLRWAVAQGKARGGRNV